MRPPSTLLQFHKTLWLFCTVLMFFNNVADAKPQGGQTMGLVGISPNAAAGVVDLSNDSWLITSEEEWNKYKSKQKNKKFKPCKVQFNADGGIEVFYDNLASTEGCSMDLVANEKDEVNFIAKVTDNNNCISEAGIEKEIIVKSNDNLLPFIIGKNNAYLTARTTGPEYGDDEDCSAESDCKNRRPGPLDEPIKCMKSTVLEIGWSRYNKSINGHLHQVGEPVASWYIAMNQKGATEGKMDVKMTSDDNVINIEIGEVGYEMLQFPGADKPICNKPEVTMKGPITRKVNSGPDEFKGKHIVFFHFFPHNATISHYGTKRYGIISKKIVNAPTCTGHLSFIFPKGSGLLAVGNKELQKTTTAGPDGSTTTGPDGPTKLAGTGGGSNEPPIETTPEPTEGSSILLIIGIVVGSVVGVVAVVILVYCCCCRAKKEADDEYADDEDVERVEDDEKLDSGESY